MKGRHLAAADVILSRGAAPSKPDSVGATPLHFAAALGSADAVSRLLSAGAALDAVNALQQTPIVGAAAADHADIVVTLLAAGASVQALSVLQWDKDSRSRVVVEAFVRSRSLLCALCWSDTVAAQRKAAGHADGLRLPRLPCEVLELVLAAAVGAETGFYRSLLKLGNEAGSVRA